MSFAPPSLPSFGNPFSADEGSPTKRMSLKALEEPNLDLAFDYNPTSFKLTRSVKWDNKTAMRSTYGLLDFQHGEADKLNFMVLLDATEAQCMGADDIATAVKDLYKLTQPHVGKGKEQQRPPLCKLSWASHFTFTGVVTKLDFNYLVFGEDGAPLRAEVTIELSGRAFSSAEPGTFFVADEAPPSLV